MAFNITFIVLSLFIINYPHLHSRKNKRRGDLNDRISILIFESYFQVLNAKTRKIIKEMSGSGKKRVLLPLCH